MAKAIRIIGEHQKDCVMLQEVAAGRQKHPWGTPAIEYRDRSGRRKGHHIWLFYPCNEPKCRCEMRVLAHEAALLATRAVSERSRA